MDNINKRIYSLGDFGSLSNKVLRTRFDLRLFVFFVVCCRFYRRYIVVEIFHTVLMSDHQFCLLLVSRL